MRPDNNPPSPVGDVLDSLLSRFGIDGKINQMKVLKSWSQVVGEAISKHSQPVSISKGNLFVKVDNSAWLSQLYHFKEKIISEFNHKQGQEVIKDIYFRVGRIYSPLSGKRKVPGKLSKTRLDKEDIQWINETLTKIKDEDLRRILRRVLSNHKKAQKIMENQKKERK